MGKPAVHYRHPNFGYHACGMGDRRKVTLTDNIEEVTCKRCLTTITGKYAGGGRPPKGDKPKVNTSVRIDPELKEQAVSAGLNLSELLEKAIQAALT